MIKNNVACNGTNIGRKINPPPNDLMHGVIGVMLSIRIRTFVNMGKLKLYDTSLPPEHIAREREMAYLSLSSLRKFQQLLALIRVSVALNGGKPVKVPQGKGLVISRHR